MRPRPALDAVLVLAIGLIAVDLVAADSFARALGELLAYPVTACAAALVLLAAVLALTSWSLWSRGSSAGSGADAGTGGGRAGGDPAPAPG